MNIQTLAWIFAAMFVLVGVLGFIPGATNNGYLLGIFEVSPLHSVIHLLSGIIAGLAAMKSAELSRVYFKLFGVIYALVTLVGFAQGDTVLGIISINAADNVLHLAIAVIALAIGFIGKDTSPLRERGQLQM